MLRIRQEMMEALSRGVLATYEDNVVAHAWRAFPERCEALGEAGTREMAQHGMIRAPMYGIVGERDVCRYIDLMFALGRDFDLDRHLPWAHEILHNQAWSPHRRLTRLCDRAIEHLRSATARGTQSKET